MLKVVFIRGGKLGGLACLPGAFSQRSFSSGKVAFPVAALPAAFSVPPAVTLGLCTPARCSRQIYLFREFPPGQGGISFWLNF